jgi:hypothetical protein
MTRHLEFSQEYALSIFPFLYRFSSEMGVEAVMGNLLTRKMVELRRLELPTS